MYALMHYSLMKESFRRLMKVRISSVYAHALFTHESHLPWKSEYQSPFRMIRTHHSSFLLGLKGETISLDKGTLTPSAQEGRPQTPSGQETGSAPRPKNQNRKSRSWGRANDPPPREPKTAPPPLAPEPEDASEPRTPPPLPASPSEPLRVVRPSTPVRGFAVEPDSGTLDRRLTLIDPLEFASGTRKPQSAAYIYIFRGGFRLAWLGLGWPGLAWQVVMDLCISACECEGFCESRLHTEGAQILLFVINFYKS